MKLPKNFGKMKGETKIQEKVKIISISTYLLSSFGGMTVAVIVGLGNNGKIYEYTRNSKNQKFEWIIKK